MPETVDFSKTEIICKQAKEDFKNWRDEILNINQRYDKQFAEFLLLELEINQLISKQNEELYLLKNSGLNQEEIWFRE